MVHRALKAFFNLSLNVAHDQLIGPDLDLNLKEMVELISILLDIPVYTNQEQHHKSYVESLHILFAVYAEFKNSAHFGKLNSY